VSETTQPPRDRFQILALDGGGAKALFTAQVLARLEQDLGVSIKDSFDLIAGTSAGGIVALGMGAGLTPSEIVGHYEEMVATVFPAARRRPWRRPRQLTAPIYDADALRTALTKVLGERLLGDSIKSVAARGGGITFSCVFGREWGEGRELLVTWNRRIEPESVPIPLAPPTPPRPNRPLP
jgi:patatin-like phospholipase/acyl hydrolase